MEMEAVIYSNSLAAVTALTALMACRRVGDTYSRVSSIIKLMVMLLTVMICLEIFNFWSNGQTQYWVLPVKYITASVHNLFTILYPGISCIFIYEYTFIREKSNVARALLISPALVWSVVLIVNYFTGFVFTIDENVVYHRGPLVYITFILPFVYYVIAVIISFSGQSGNRNLVRFPIWTFAIPGLGFMLFQALTPGVSTIHLGLALGLCGACILIQRERIFIDSLTGLYNRSYLFYMFTHMSKRKSRLQAGAVMLDIIDFQYIHDKYGHIQGDIAITEAASILTASLVDGATAVRFAGDEFVIFIKSSDVREAMDETIKRILANTDSFNESGTRRYKLQFAIGSSVLDEKEPPDDFLSRIEEEMYLDKQNKLSLRRRLRCP